MAATNPCPCGYFGNSTSDSSGNSQGLSQASSRNYCRCTPDQIRRYLAKISGPLLDRIDMQVEVPLLSQQQLTDGHKHDTTELSSSEFRKSVIACQKVQLTRQHKLNGQLTSSELEQFCCLSQPAKSLLLKALERLKLSARSYHRVLKVARTIADLSKSKSIQPSHISETLQYRQMERYLARLP